MAVGSGKGVDPTIFASRREKEREREKGREREIDREREGWLWAPTRGGPHYICETVIEGEREKEKRRSEREK